MGLKDCVISLDNPWNTYYPGQTINGSADFTFDAPKKVRGIFIRFKGECETSWSSNTTRRDAEGKSTQVTVQHTGKEEYFSITYYLVGSKSGNEIELPPGTHKYPFTCALPPTLPSSFEGEFGHVRYTIKVTLDRPWKFDQETKMAFTVVSHMDLNVNPEYRAPMQLHIEKNFCCCWCKSGPLVVDVNLPVSGYCSGQVIPLDVSCENGSNVNVNDIHIEMRKIVKFRAQVPTAETKESKITIAEMKMGTVSGNSSKNWRETIQVPPLPPSNLTNCSLIDLDYDIKVTCVPSGMHMKMDTSKLLIIGTVPIAGFESPMPENGQGDGGMLPSSTGEPPSAPSDDISAPGNHLYPTLMQPTFQEGQFAARGIHDASDSEQMLISGNSNFAPRYPTYGPR